MPNVDVKAFIDLHPTGKYGMDHPREIPLTKQQYFGQRLLNEDSRFSSDPMYIFSSQQIVL